MTENPSPSPADRPWLASYADRVPLELGPVTGSLLTIVQNTAAAHPESVALDFFGRETRYRELTEQIDRAAEGLRRLGVTAGDVVAIVLPNCPQHIVAFYAVLRLGAVVVEHNPLYTPRELRHQFEDHGATVAIVWNNVVSTVQEFPSDLAVEHLVSVDLVPALPLRMRAALRLPVRRAREGRAALTTPVSGTLTWERLLSSGAIDPAHPLPSRDDVAVLQYTSGTTGAPKGAILTHANLLANADQAQAWVPDISRGDCVVYAVLPMFHAYGLTLCLTFAMSMGARLVLFPKFDPELVLTAIRSHPPTFLPLVPPIAERLLAAATEKHVSLADIEIAISGAMPLRESLVTPWEEATGGYLVEGYGLSECSPVLMANPVAPNRRAGTVGLPLPGTDLRIAVPESPERVLPLGEEGELQARGPQVFSGYVGHPDETAAAFTADGWFRTGDIARILDGGFVTIVDRIKELIITGGFNVAPSEVEDVLRSHPSVDNAAVVGLPSEHSGEDVVAAVVAAPGAVVDGEELRAYVRERLTPYKVPRRVVVVDELPLSLIGKVLRRRVREQLLERS
ncbi:long-chain-fatty-acid--CoA ligase [Mycetocola reblochoni]|uniref:Long-chain-fatty-acid--CoA ligase n=1 Tax=Mycetocola reblochoni REB411 TaxID=1255698 RepID=A0A1R4JCC5_9MICO|nr:long-chain-fatty-acid--CoA ligase [Mycetocola reblochoni]SJN29697.1 Long-chain-fatty-acid--CoA ligase [Mycetocola reblochoni REB411]